jgi:hypothetical protein
VYQGTPSSRGSLLAALSRTGIPFAGLPGSDVWTAAIDGRDIRVAAALNVLGSKATVALATREPYSDISARLRRSGFRSKGRYLLAGDGGGHQGYPVVTLHEGLLILAGSRQTAEQALAGLSQRLTDPARTLVKVGGVTKAASSGGGCMAARVVGEDLVPRRGEYLVFPTDLRTRPIAPMDVSTSEGRLTVTSARLRKGRYRGHFVWTDYLFPTTALEVPLGKLGLSRNACNAAN